MNFAALCKYWNDGIHKFLVKERPDLTGKPTIGYFRFLESRQMLSKEAADILCQYAALKNFPSPETYVRVRRILSEKGLIHVPKDQQARLDGNERAARSHYGQDKRRNPVWR